MTSCFGSVPGLLVSLLSLAMHAQELVSGVVLDGCFLFMSQSLGQRISTSLGVIGEIGQVTRQVQEALPTYSIRFKVLQCSSGDAASLTNELPMVYTSSFPDRLSFDRGAENCNAKTS